MLARNFVGNLRFIRQLSNYVKSMAPTLYYYEGCPSCSGTLMTIQALGIDVEKKHLSLPKQEHMSPEYLKINPQHSVPALVDGDLVMWESRPIMMYLAEQYAAGSELYPQDAKKRAIINQRLFFDVVTLGARFNQCYMPVLKQGAPALDAEKEKLLHEALKILDGFLGETKWVALDVLTIADTAMATCVSFMKSSHVDFEPYPNIRRWIQQCQDSMPGYNTIAKKATDIFYELLVKNCAALKK